MMQEQYRPDLVSRILKKNTVSLLATALFAMVFSFISSPGVQASTLNCDDLSAYQYLSGDLPAGDYLVYSMNIEADRPVLAQAADDCVQLAPSKEPISVFGKIGVISATSDRAVSILVGGESQTNGAVPKILLVPIQSTASVKGSEILMKIPGINIDAEVTPVAFASDDGRISVQFLTDENPRYISHTNYFVNGKFVGKSNLPVELSGYFLSDSKASQVSMEVLYKSGMKLTASLNQQDALFDQDSIWSALSWYLRKVPPVILLLFAAPIAYVLFWLIRLPFRLHKRHQLDRIARGLIHPEDTLYSRLPDGVRLFVYSTGKAIKYTAIFSMIAIVAAFFLVDAFKVSGDSMESTLQDGRVLVISKTDRLGARMLGRQYAPSRGDIVILKTMLSSNRTAVWGIQQQGTIVKRVAGLPGETVTVSGDEVTIKTLSGETINFDSGSSWDATRHAETRPLAVTTVLARDEIFVIGDNRPGSTDSRINGPSLIDDIVGRVLVQL